MDPFVGRMRPNASADEAGIYVQCHPSFPFADGYPNRHQQPVTALSFKTSNTRAQDHTSKISMDQLSLHYSYLNLNDSQALIAAPDSNFQNVANSVEHPPLEFPIHAPVPSSGHCPVFMQPDYIYQLENAGQTPDVFFTPQGHFADAQGVFALAPDEVHCSVDYQSLLPEDFSNSNSLQRWHDASLFDAGGPMPSHETFLTPSELRLAEMEAKAQAQFQLADNSLNEGRVESASKARRRAMARSIGFTPTDPDIISSHEKKRHYLECLEQYVMYLHEQFELVGVAPDRLERVASYKGLSSKSIRTLLVHMKNTTRKLNIRTQAEEQKYYNLSKEILQRESNGA